MTPETLADVMGRVLSLDQYSAYCDRINKAMLTANCTTVPRAANFLAQVREESVGLRYKEELGSDSYLRAKEYYPYVGRGFIQVTWESNYASFGAYCKKLGLVLDANKFVKNPAALAADKWAALTIAWYWSETHAGFGYTYLNQAADAGDIVAARKMVNGRLAHGLDEVTNYWHYAASLGDAILPTTGASMLPWRKNIEARLDALAKQQADDKAVNDRQYKRLESLDNRITSLRSDFTKYKNAR